VRYFFDTEFIEKPCTIDLISIGIVAEDGREFYCVSSEFDEDSASGWVKENVISKLGSDTRLTKEEIKFRLLDFTAGDNKPEFWAYYADYDWVVFCWLFGTMMDLPKNFPMFCRDIMQLSETKGFPLLPKMEEGEEHNALNDAIWSKQVYEYLNNITEHDA
jgi:3'-5' exoribonuclease-like protein